MRKVLCFIGMILGCGAMLCGCDVSEMTTLSELSKPYLGIYECEEIFLGGEDMTEKFEHIYLELGYNGEFELTYFGADGNEGGYKGTYEADTEAGEITLTAGVGPVRKSFTFPFEKGCIYIDVPLNGKLLHACFSMP